MKTQISYLILEKKYQKNKNKNLNKIFNKN